MPLCVCLCADGTQANVIKADASCVCRVTRHAGKRSQGAVMEGYKPQLFSF